MQVNIDIYLHYYMLRLLRINDLMAYKNRIERLTAQGLDEMVAISQESIDTWHLKHYYYFAVR